MTRTVCRLLMVVALASALAPHALGQGEMLPPSSEVIPSPPRLYFDPALDSAFAPPPANLPDVVMVEAPAPAGWYVALGVGLVGPHVQSRISSGVPVSPALPTAMRLPTAPLCWTGMPDVKIGYRFAGGQDELRARYQGVFTSGSEIFANFDAWGSGIVHNRLAFNMIDIDYVSREFLAWAMGPAPTRYLDILFGLRTGNISYESVGFGTQVIAQGMRNSVTGFGPHVGMDYSRALFGPRVGGYLILDAAGLVSSLNQQFVDVRFLNNGRIVGGELRRQSWIGVGNVQLEPGLRFLPLADPRFRMSIGYTWQRWWYLGNSQQSNAELTIQGIMFRGEFAF